MYTSRTGDSRFPNLAVWVSGDPRGWRQAPALLESVLGVSIFMGLGDEYRTALTLRGGDWMNAGSVLASAVSRWLLMTCCLHFFRGGELSSTAASV